jgi:hypothetical protein
MTMIERRALLRHGGLVMAGLLCMTGADTVPADPGAQYLTSASGAFRLRYQSLLEPPTINRMHAWVLWLENHEGEPVVNARVAVTGGMPDHDHGLPTSPRMTQARDDGSYLVEGMRFHMNGYWRLEVAVQAGDIDDIVVIEIDL